MSKEYNERDFYAFFLELNSGNSNISHELYERWQEYKNGAQPKAPSPVIEKKDWEIVSIMSNHHKNTPLYVKAAIDAWLDGNEKDSWHIHSVKRLSDSIVFTVGDNCIQGNIKKFEFSYWGKEITAIFESGEVGCVVRLNDLSHAPIPQVREVLFTTEDGVDIMDGDDVYSVTKSFFHDKPFKATKLSIHRDTSSWLFFSSEEKRQEYILLNKPCLSVNDVSELWDNDRSYVGSEWLLDRIKTLAKQKIDNNGTK